MTLYYVCVATENKLYFPYLKQLIPDLVVLGMNKKWKGFSTKIKLIYKFLKTLNDNDIVCIIDAYDILPIKQNQQIEKRFVKIIDKNPNVKIIIGYDKNDNDIDESFSQYLFGSFNGKRINGGNYMGYVKNILYIYRIILQNEYFKDDQIELTKYLNKFPEHVYIDTNKIFFNVVNKPLLQNNIDENCKSYFIHANMNGYLEDFLLEHHNIIVNPIDRIHNVRDNFNGVIKKLNMYKQYFLHLF
jgi:hypothetical protein